MFKSQNQQDDFFRQVAAEITTPCDLHIYGGTAMICLGLPNRQTVDVDVYTAGQTQLRAATERIAARFQAHVDDFDPNAFVQLPANLIRPPKLYKRFGMLSVYIVDPHRIALDKLDRASEGDINDIRWLLATKQIGTARMSACIEAARDVEDRQAMRDRFAELAGLPANPSISRPRTTSNRPGSSWRMLGLVIALACAIVIILLLLTAMIVIGSR